MDQFNAAARQFAAASGAPLFIVDPKSTLAR